jgi:hypothetical protein
MDLDNILYIVIAIVLASINGVAQKKKKNAQHQKAAPKPASSFDPFNEVDEEPVQQEDYQPIQIEDVLKELNKKFNIEEEYIPKTTLTYKPVEEIIDKPFSSIDLAESKSFAPIDTPENAIFKPVDTYVSAEDGSEEIADYTFDFEKDSIASTAITDALSADEEQEASLEKRSEILKDFNPKLAVVYSEIITPKYVTVRNN